jgi:hypothetical protein
MKAFTVLFALLLVLPQARAAQDGTHWLTLIQSLESMGVRKVGSFDLAKFKNQALRIPFISSDEAPPSLLAGSRRTAYYITQAKRIYIMPNQSEADRAALPQLELHELLGVLGYGDADTSKSTALVAIEQTRSAAERNELIAQYGASLFSKRPTQLAGGFSVGGGGDLSMIRLKSEVLRYVRETTGGAVSSDFFRKFPSINFEPLSDGRGVALNHKFSLRGRGYSESFSVYVPTSRLNESERGAIIQEVAVKLLSIFPMQTGNGRVYSPDVCRNGESIQFPEPADSDVAFIQRNRARIILGCTGVENLTGGESTVGIRSSESLPKTPGLHSFACSLSYGDKQNFYQYTQTTMAGVGGDFSRGLSLDPDDSLSLQLTTNARGQLVSGVILYLPPGGVRNFQRTVQRATNANEVVVLTQINGSPLRFECQRER